RGAAEVTRSVEGLFAFAATLPARLDRQFEILYDATLGNETVDNFLRQENPQAREAKAAGFDEAIRRGLWRPRRNSGARVREASCPPSRAGARRCSRRWSPATVGSPGSSRARAH